MWQGVLSLVVSLESYAYEYLNILGYIFEGWLTSIFDQYVDAIMWLLLFCQAGITRQTMYSFVFHWCTVFLIGLSQIGLLPHIHLGFQFACADYSKRDSVPRVHDLRIDSFYGFTQCLTFHCLLGDTSAFILNGQSSL